MDGMGIIGVVTPAILTVAWECGIRPLPCPKFNWKDLLAFVGAASGSLIYLSVLGSENPLTSIDVLTCTVVGFAFGRFIYKVFCPIPIK